jgi:hypothetical protein
VRLHLCKQVARERQIADPLSRCRENRVAKRGAPERALFSMHFELYHQFPFLKSGQSVERLHGRSEASRLGHKLIA